MIKFSTRSGQALLEVVVAMGILVIFASAFAKLTIGSYDTGRQAREQTEATFFAQKSLEAVHSVARRDWDSLTGSSLGLQIMTGAYALSDTPDTSGKFTRTIDITDVERDGNDDIVESGGTVDDSTRKIMTTVTWNVGEGRPNAISFVSYITQWFASSISTWFIDLLSDFQQGFLNGTELTETGNGEVQLKDIGYFSNATELTTEDLDGTADVTDIHIDSVTDRLYMTTTEYAGGSNPEFFVYDISNMSDSAMTLSGSLDLDAGSNGFALGTDYAYVLTNDDSAEVQVVRLSDLTIVATWDVPSGNLKQATWVGSDGTNTTAYTLSSGEDITTDPNADGTRFIQWKAYFSGSGSVSPVLEDVTLTYE